MRPLERKSIESMALVLARGNVQAMQPCMRQGQWQDAALLRKPWALVDGTWDEADGEWIVDGSDVPKSGEPAVGMARRNCAGEGFLRCRGEFLVCLLTCGQFLRTIHLSRPIYAAT
jgi:SRSO17 transposase